MDRDLARLRLENFPFHANDISDIHLLEILISLFTNTVPRNIRLDIPALVKNIAERSLSHDTLLHDASGKRHLLPFHLLKMLFNVHGMACHVKLCDLKWIFSVAL